MKKQTFILAFLVGITLSASAQKPTKLLSTSGNITSNRTLSKDTIYILDRPVYVRPGATLTIPAGTIIKGKVSSAGIGTLIIDRGAKIDAQGTATEPIVFTSASAPGSRATGDWAGIIIVGKAPINKSITIEGGNFQVDHDLNPSTPPSNDPLVPGTDPNDDSGIMRYVRIEYAGHPIAPNSEVNSLSCYGVGRGTKLEYIQCSYGNDDDFEFFGGTVDAKYLVGYAGVDDKIDTDFGYQGRLQFVYIVCDPAIADAAGDSNGLESDNNNVPDFATPRTQPTISNMTIVGPLAFSSSFNPKYGHAARIRRNSLYYVYNSIFAGYPSELRFEPASVQAAQADSIHFRNNIFAGHKNTANTWLPNSGSFLPRAWIKNSAFNNDTLVTIAEVKFENITDNTSPLNNPIASLKVGSPALGTASFAHTPLSDPFFTTVNYKGAFPATGGPLWTDGWTEWNPQSRPYDGATSINESGFAQFELSQNIPNPFSTTTNVVFNVEKNTNLVFNVVDMMGRTVYQHQDSYAPGTHTLQFDASHLPSGIYYMNVTDGLGTKTLKMVVSK
ncbi:MAG: T9SS type A sorting domain-containing protein [Bacteroidia bacterium]|nr:T9SS type A sorting domain-containing protein [Bacteroidia bacterium]